MDAIEPVSSGASWARARACARASIVETDGRGAVPRVLSEAYSGHIQAKRFAKRFGQQGQISVHISGNVDFRGNEEAGFLRFLRWRLPYRVSDACSGLSSKPDPGPASVREAMAVRGSGRARAMRATHLTAVAAALVLVAASTACAKPEPVVSPDLLISSVVMSKEESISSVAIGELLRPAPITAALHCFSLTRAFPQSFRQSCITRAAGACTPARKAWSSPCGTASREAGRATA